MDFKNWINESALETLRKRFSKSHHKEDAPDFEDLEKLIHKEKSKPLPDEGADARCTHLQRIMNMNQDWEERLKDESVSNGGKRFLEWLKLRTENTFAAGGSGVMADAPGEVKAPTDPKEIARRKAVNDFTSQMMRKNPQLKPGGTDQQQVANMTKSDPGLAKADPETQQAVTSFFLKK
jgi:hypothetical protein